MNFILTDLLSRCFAPSPSPSFDPRRFYASRENNKNSNNKEKDEKEKKDKLSLHLGWCTATGTSQRLALLSAADANDSNILISHCSCVSELAPAVGATYSQQQQHSNSSSSSCSSSSSSSSSYYFLLLFIATQGDGDSPPSWELFKSSIQDHLCTQEEKEACAGFHIFALGDTSYRKFCEAGKRAKTFLDSHFSDAKTTQTKEEEEDENNITFCDARLGANAVEELVETECAKLFEKLSSKFDLSIEDCSSSVKSSSSSPSSSSTPLRCQLFPPSEKPPKPLPFPSPASIQPASAEKPIELKLANPIEILSKKSEGAARDVVQITFDAAPLLSRSVVQAGDHLAVYCANSMQLAKRCAAALSLGQSSSSSSSSSSSTLSVVSTVMARNRATPKEVMPATISLLNALRYYPDLSGPPRKRLISKIISTCCCCEETLEQDREKILAASKKEFATTVDVLEAAASIVRESSSSSSNNSSSQKRRIISLEEFFFLCPRLSPRFFSVCDVWKPEEEKEEDHEKEEESENQTSKKETSRTEGGVENHKNRNKNKRKNKLQHRQDVLLEQQQQKRCLSILVALLPGGCFSEMICRQLERQSITNNNKKKKKEGEEDEGEEKENDQEIEKAQFFVYVRRTPFHPVLKKSIPSTSSSASAVSAATSSASASLPSSFPSSSCPLILIGAGTGIAPFIGFLREIQNAQESQQQQQQQRKKFKVGVFYGFTTISIGSPFLEFLRNKATTTSRNDSSPLLTFLSEAESRPHIRLLGSSSQQQAIRVPQRVSERAQELAKLIVEENAFVYICGRSGMASGVEDALLKDVLIRAGKMSEENAVNFLMQMRNNQKLRLDVWESG